MQYSKANQESNIRISELQLAIDTLPEYSAATESERRAVLAKMLYFDLERANWLSVKESNQ